MSARTEKVSALSPAREWGRGYFLCGCHTDRGRVRRVQGTHAEIIFTNYDKEGYLTCPEHGEREYGWRTGPVKMDASGRTTPDFSKMAKFMAKPQ